MPQLYAVRTPGWPPTVTGFLLSGVAGQVSPCHRAVQSIMKLVNAARSCCHGAAATKIPRISCGWPKRSTSAELPSSSDWPSHFPDACCGGKPSGTVAVYPYASDLNVVGCGAVDCEELDDDVVTAVLPVGDDGRLVLLLHAAMRNSAASRDMYPVRSGIKTPPGRCWCCGWRSRSDPAQREHALERQLRMQ